MYAILSLIVSRLFLYSSKTELKINKWGTTRRTLSSLDNDLAGDTEADVVMCSNLNLVEGVWSQASQLVRSYLQRPVLE